MLLRDLALGRRRDLLSAATLLIVPIYNVDGHERVSPFNRPNQDGPVAGMGFRTTADGHDLNRDFLKLATPEARQLVQLVNDWQPHLFVDTHVTDGVDLDWVITWAVPEAPLLAEPLDRWLRRNFPPVLAAVEAAGHLQGPYVSLVDGQDPTRGFETLVYEPRFSTGYFPLRNRPAVLLESHSHKPYRQRVLATRDFLAALVVETGRAGLALKSAIAEAALAVVQQGQPAAAPSTIDVTYARGESEPYRVPFYDWTIAPSVVSGGDQIRYRRGVVKELEVPWFHRLVVAKSLPRPRGYLVLPGWSGDRAPVGRPWPALRAPVAGARTGRRGRAALRAATGRSELSGVDADSGDRGAGERAQNRPGRSSLGAGGSARLRGRGAAARARSSGLGPLLGPCFESLRRQGVHRWRCARPATRARRSSIRQSPGMAEGARRSGFRRRSWARYRWWFARTPYWDEQIGLYPVLRLMQPLPQPQERQLELTPETVPR